LNFKIVATDLLRNFQPGTLNLKPFFDKLSNVQTYEQNESVNSPSPIENRPLTPASRATEPPLSPDNPPWNWITAFSVWLASVALLLIVPTIMVIPYAINKGINFQNGEALKDFLLNDSAAILIQIGFVIPVHALTLALSWAVVTNFKKFSFPEMLGWKWGGFRLWHIIVVIMSYFLLSAGLRYIFGEHENELTRILKSSRTAVYLIAFMATFTAPIIEEVVYRGLLYSAFQKRFGISTAVFVVTLLFAGVHYFQYWGDWTALIVITLLSLTLTLIRVKTSNLLPCIILHTVFNSISALYIILEPFLPKQINQIPEQTAYFFHFLK
jgi:membrane protease YdiL (CAAX protease family)